MRQTRLTTVYLRVYWELLKPNHTDQWAESGWKLQSGVFIHSGLDRTGNPHHEKSLCQCQNQTQEKKSRKKKKKSLNFKSNPGCSLSLPACCIFIVLTNSQKYSKTCLWYNSVLYNTTQSRNCSVLFLPWTDEQRTVGGSVPIRMTHANCRIFPFSCITFVDYFDNREFIRELSIAFLIMYRFISIM